MTAHGFFHWNELMTRDVGKARAFYEKTIGWTFDEMPMPEGIYYVAMLGEKPVGGIYEMKGKEFDGVPEHWMSYLAVDDVDARVKIAVAEGAVVMKEAIDIPQVGRFAILKDGGGAVIGWMTPADM